MDADAHQPEPLPAATVNGGHPLWCIKPNDESRCHDHESVQVTVDGRIPVVVEVVKMPEDARPLVSILPVPSDATLRMEAAQALAVSAVLERAALTAATFGTAS
jgi:hypothetical protein